MTVADIQQ